MATNAPLKTDIKQHLHGKVNKGPKSSHFILKRAERMRIVLYSLFQIYSPNFIPEQISGIIYTLMGLCREI